MNKDILFSVFLSVGLSCWAQPVMHLKPELGTLIDKSANGAKEAAHRWDQCEAFWESDMSMALDFDALSDSIKDFLISCDEKPYWAAIEPGCSWYCGGGLDTNTATSELPPSGLITYSAKNIHDLDLETAWIEGVPGFGIGEKVTYHFPPQNPRITEIIVVNGYVKSIEAWENNSRVKTLKMFLNGQPYAVLHLADSRREQHFTFKPLGYGQREDWKALEAKPWWEIAFEIVEVYPGKKYEDTAITEIYFDGIDVH